jgi:hypothetical protein
MFSLESSYELGTGLCLVREERLKQQKRKLQNVHQVYGRKRSLYYDLCSSWVRITMTTFTLYTLYMILEW